MSPEDILAVRSYNPDVDDDDDFESDGESELEVASEIRGRASPDTAPPAARISPDAILAVRSYNPVYEEEECGEVEAVADSVAEVACTLEEASPETS